MSMIVLLAASTTYAFKLPSSAGFSSHRRSVLATASSLLAAAAPQCSAHADEVDTSPLMEELKRRTALKRENAADAKQTSANFKFVSYDESKGDVMVRYQGVDDEGPVTRTMSPNQIKALESKGFLVKCPSWGGECALFFGPARMP
jgi:hypothetical protein